MKNFLIKIYLKMRTSFELSSEEKQVNTLS